MKKVILNYFVIANLAVSATFTSCGVRPINAQDNMILINGGSYKMGDFTGKRHANERPVHDVFWTHFT